MRPSPAAALPAALLALSAHAQDTAAPAVRLPEVVATATRVPLPVTRIPAGVTVIDRAAIERRGPRTLADALDGVPGLRIVQQGGPGGSASVFIRGTNSNHVLVLRDGMPINDPSTSNGLFNFGTEFLADVERIEIVRGPMSGVYGSGAIGGVINLISRRGRGAPSLVAEATAGVPRSAAGQASLGGEAGPVDYAFTVESASLRGDDVIPRRVATRTGERDGFRGTVATVHLGLSPRDDTRLSAFLRGRTVTFGYDNIGFPAFDDPNQTGEDDNLTWRIGGTTRAIHPAWESALFLGQSRDDRRFTNLLDADDPNFGEDDSRYRGRRTDLQWNNTLDLPDIGASLSAVALTFGYQRQRDAAEVRLRDSGFAQDVDRSATSDALYAGLQATLLDRLSLSGNLRGESTEDAGDATTWRAGGVFALPEAAARLHAAIGTSFRAPTIFDRYGVGSFGFRGNPDLKAERGRSWEAGVEVDPLPGAVLRATYFRTRIRDLIQTTADFSTLENVGRAEIDGIEAELRWDVARWLSVALGYTWTDARNADTDERLLRRPEHQGSLRLDIRPLPALAVVPEILVFGRARDALVDDDGFPAGLGSNRGGTVLNLAASYALTEQVALLVRGRNLTDADYEPASGFALPGLSVTAGARVRF